MIEPNGLKVEVGESPLKAIRNLLGMSQQQFANWLEMSMSTLSRWERGEGTPVFTPGQFKLLLAALKEKGLSINDIPDDLSLKTQ